MWALHNIKDRSKLLIEILEPIRKYNEANIKFSCRKFPVFEYYLRILALKLGDNLIWNGTLQAHSQEIIAPPFHKKGGAPVPLHPPPGYGPGTLCILNLSIKTKMVGQFIFKSEIWTFVRSIALILYAWSWCSMWALLNLRINAWSLHL